MICRQALRQVLVLQHFAALWLDVKAESPGCGCTFLRKKKSVHFPSCVHKLKRQESRLTAKTTKARKNWLRRETVSRPEFTWLTYQDHEENRGRASAETFVRFLRQDNVLQNLAIIRGRRRPKKSKEQIKLNVFIRAETILPNTRILLVKGVTG